MSAITPAIAEIFLLTMACVVLIADLFVTDNKRTTTYVLTLLSLVGTFVVVLLSAPESRTLAFHDSYVSDTMSTVLKAAVCLVSFGVIVYSREYLIQRNMNRGEFFVLALTGVLGMMVMISANSLLSVYMGLELLSLSLYAMVAFDRDSPTAGEAAMKYFVLGALASGMLLYGMSIVYGVTGSLNLHEIGAAVSAEGGRTLGLLMGVVFIVVGLAFKFGAVPFHMWVPDVYEGSPTAVTTYIASAPKIAAFAMAIRILVEGLEGVHADWQGMLVILTILSLAIGNIVAIAQTSIKRMLAYSTISHIGFLLLGVLSASPEGYSAAMFYSMVYALMSAGGFGMVILLSRQGFEADQLDDYKGLNERSPWFAFIMLILMFSMAGVPPTVGFYAKLSVLQAVVQADMAWLAVVAVIFSVIGAFYYLRVIKMMYFDKPEATEPVRKTMDLRLVLSTNGLLVLALGIYPSGLMALCISALGPVGG